MPTLPSPLPATQREITGAAGGLALYEAGSGTPVLLIHSVNAAASAYEVRPLFERLSATHRVFAIDLPGYGRSPRTDRRYDIALFTAAIEDALDAIGESCGDAPVDLIAVSLSCEFAARAAVNRPQRLRTLTLVTPTGLDRRSAALDGAPGQSREVPGVHRVLTWPLWSQALFNLLSSGPSVRYFLRRTWGSSDIDAGLAEYCVASARQPGARFAPLSFLCFRLFAADVRSLYSKLQMPVWVPHATRGDFRDFSGADFLRSRPNWRFQPFESGALVYFEMPDAFVAAWRRFAEDQT
jgi:pimeloyl-ACP methyl ester carboxylesterase